MAVAPSLVVDRTWTCGWCGFTPDNVVNVMHPFYGPEMDGLPRFKPAAACCKPGGNNAAVHVRNDPDAKQDELKLLKSDESERALWRQQVFGAAEAVFINDMFAN